MTTTDRDAKWLRAGLTGVLHSDPLYVMRRCRAIATRLERQTPPASVRRVVKSAEAIISKGDLHWAAPASDRLLREAELVRALAAHERAEKRRGVKK